MMLWLGSSMGRRASHLHEVGGEAKEWRLSLQGVSGFKSDNVQSPASKQHNNSMMIWPGSSMGRRAPHLQEAEGEAKEWRLSLQG